ncbi:MAG: glycosyltransferase family 4 protein [Deltaproteobacteria bacterium]|nr:glycosyltransferase family 4 protein [Deltaproteobacteria bacterium]
MKKLVVALLASELHNHLPRGVPRVARGLSEQLCCFNRLETICLTRRIPNQLESTYEYGNLCNWLKSHPLQVPLHQKILDSPEILFPNILPPFVLKKYHHMKSFFNRIQKRVVSKPQKPYISLNDIDIVLSFNPFSDFWNLPVENHSALAIGWFHDAIPIRINEGRYWRLDNYLSAISRMVLKASKIVCVSQSSENDLNNFFPNSLGKTTVIYNGHDIKRFQAPIAQTPDLNPIIKKFKIKAGTPYFVAVGKIEERKNIRNIIKAAIFLKNKSPSYNFQVLVIGDKRLKKDFSSLLSQLKGTAPIVFTGYLEDEIVATLLSLATAFLYPSLWEGFGIPMLEAMSAGTIVITSDISAMPEIAKNCAIYCDPYDPIDIANAMEQSLLMTATERKRMADQGRIHASNFTWNNSAKTLMELFDEITST